MEMEEKIKFSDRTEWILSFLPDTFSHVTWVVTQFRFGSSGDKISHQLRIDAVEVKIKRFLERMTEFCDHNEDGDNDDYEYDDERPRWMWSLRDKPEDSIWKWIQNMKNKTFKKPS